MDELQTIHKFINDYWKLVKQYLDIDAHDQPRWAALNADCQKLNEKYHNHRFAQINLLNLVEYLDERSEQECH